MKTVTYDETKWRLVPVEPTREMVEAGERVRSGLSGLPPTLYFVWPAMVSVSQEPPAAESKAEPDEQAADSLNEWLDTCDESGSSIQHRIECAGLNEMLAWVERAFNAGRDSVERPPAAEPQGQQHTGWPPGMLQDDSRELARALSSKPDARLHVREAAAAIGAERVPLSDDDIVHACIDQEQRDLNSFQAGVRFAEAAHGIRGKS